MKTEQLGRHFAGVVAKLLKPVEVDPKRSNQHEFNSVNGLKSLLGEQRRIFPAKFLYFDRESDTPDIWEDKVTWYDSRERHPVRSEYRLYFSEKRVFELTSPGDLLIIGRRSDRDELVAIIVDSRSSYLDVFLKMFGISDISERFSFGDADREVLFPFSSSEIFRWLDIGVQHRRDIDGEQLAEEFGGKFPSTDEFSRYTRDKFESEYGPADISDPDLLLVEWIRYEEDLFRALEHYLVEKKLVEGFVKNGKVDVDGFVSFSLSVQNRRKSRMGHALENHLKEIFRLKGLRFSHNQVTEGKKRPDFIFPDIECYRDRNFPEEFLSMLGAKSTCKDRWRQVLSEADRIRKKHLVTLEEAISENQTYEMAGSGLQLVAPKVIFNTFSENQQKWLMSVRDFLNYVCDLEKHAIKRGWLNEGEMVGENG